MASVFKTYLKHSPFTSDLVFILNAFFKYRGRFYDESNLSLLSMGYSYSSLTILSYAGLVIRT